MTHDRNFPLVAISAFGGLGENGYVYGGTPSTDNGFPDRPQVHIIFVHNFSTHPFQISSNIRALLASDPRKPTICNRHFLTDTVARTVASTRPFARRATLRSSSRGTRPSLARPTTHSATGREPTPSPVVLVVADSDKTSLSTSHSFGCLNRYLTRVNSEREHSSASQRLCVRTRVTDVKMSTGTGTVAS
jgi:hypothetical protein